MHSETDGWRVDQQSGSVSKQRFLYISSSILATYSYSHLSLIIYQLINIHVCMCVRARVGLYLCTFIDLSTGGNILAP